MTFRTEEAAAVIDEVLRLGDDKRHGNVSRHIFELLENYAELTVSGATMLRLFSKVAEAARRNGETRTLIWISEVSQTSVLEVRSDVTLDGFSTCLAQSTVHLFDGADFLIDASEEYRNVLGHAQHPAISGALYRSWRSEAAQRNAWEFSNDLYFWSLPTAE